MGRQRPVDVDHGAAAEIVVGEEQAGEFAGSFGVRAARSKIVGAGRRNEQCRRRRRRANPAEPAPPRASQIEDAKVQSRRSLDEDGLFVSCGHPDRYLVPHCAVAVKSLRTTLPPFITNFTRCSSVMSASGSPDTATRSAYLPFVIEPIWSFQPIASALTIVPA